MIKTLCAGLLLLLVLLPPVAGGAGGEAQTGAAEEKGAGLELSGAQGLELARQLLEAGNARDAGKIYNLLLFSRRREISIEAAFQLAQLYSAEGRHPEAIALYMDILNQNPALARVRLELARAYFLNKDYEDARFQFELVKGGELPPPVLEKVDFFLELIRRQKDWNFDFSFALVPDSNINQASGGREECIATVFGLLCRPLEEKQRGLGLSAGASFDHFLRFSRDFGLRSTIGLDILEHEQRANDDYIFTLASGPRYIFESGETSLQPLFRKRWIAGKEYSEEFGLRWDIHKIWGRLLLNSGASFSNISYADSYVDGILRGHNRFAYIQPRYILDDRTFAQAGLSFSRNSVRMDAYGEDSLRYSLGAYHFFAYGFSLFAELSLIETRYHDKQWYVTRDHRFDETRREDKTWQFYASLSSNIFESKGVTPVLQYYYVKRDSNIWSREYDRHRINLAFNIRF